MTEKKAESPIPGLIALAIIGALVYACTQGSNSAEDRKAAIQASTDPSQIAALVLGDKAKPSATRRGQAIDIEFHLEPSWNGPWTATSFQHKAAELFPIMFTNIKDVDAVRIIARSELVDVRGNTSESIVARATLTRKNNSKIQWPNVVPSNLPRFADDYWEHPVMKK